MRYKLYMTICSTYLVILGGLPIVATSNELSTNESSCEYREDIASNDKAPPEIKSLKIEIDSKNSSKAGNCIKVTAAMMDNRSGVCFTAICSSVLLSELTPSGCHYFNMGPKHVIDADCIADLVDGSPINGIFTAAFRLEHKKVKDEIFIIFGDNAGNNQLLLSSELKDKGLPYEILIEDQ